MEEANNKKMNFFVRIYKSITSFDTYTRFANEKISVAIKYLSILILIFALIVTSIYIVSFKSKISTGLEYLEKNIENINFNNKAFSYNNDQYTIYNDEGAIIPIVIIDTGLEPNIDEYKARVKLYNYGCILLRDNMMIFMSSGDAEGEFTTISYSDYNIEDMNKQDILNAFRNPMIYVYIFIAVFIVDFIQYFIYALLNAVTLAIIGQILAIILRLKLKFNETYKMGIYALTLPILLELLYIIVNTATGLVIQYFSWMYTTISYIYICVAILMIKTDFINLQKQLIKIKNEEQNNNEEQNQIEEEPKEEEKKKDEDNNNDEVNDDLKEQTDG